jgi:uncharacterized membrane-anchored protein YhcB (DUF1043 family)
MSDQPKRPRQDWIVLGICVVIALAAGFSAGRAVERRSLANRMFDNIVDQQRQFNKDWDRSTSRFERDREAFGKRFDEDRQKFDESFEQSRRAFEEMRRGEQPSAPETSRTPPAGKENE